MRKWPALQWIKVLSILLLLFLNGYLVYRLLPLLGVLFHFFLRIAVPFFAAGAIAYLLHPLVKRCVKAGIPKTVAILLIYAIFFGGIGFLFYKGGPVFLQEIKGLDDEFEEYAAMYRVNIDHVYGSTPEAVHDQVNEALRRMRYGITRSSNRLVDWGSSLIKSFFTLVIVPFLAFYFLKDANRIKKGAVRLIPEKWRERTVNVFSEMDRSLGNYIRGQLTVCAILAVLAALGLWILKVPYPIALGVFIGATDIIPYFGPLIGALPAVLFAATQSVYAVLGVLLMILLIQFLEGNVIEPLVVGKSADIHPLYIMLSLGIGGEIAGIVGMLLAVPVFIVLRISARHMKGFFQTIDK
ncbi:AI-2E family transporter [Sporolactobacillus sp. THM7-7]|nr:AI-2E family transporter [Sporolactobacillus sp. THM7-7]